MNLIDRQVVQNYKERIMIPTTVVNSGIDDLPARASNISLHDQEMVYGGKCRYDYYYCIREYRGCNNSGCGKKAERVGRVSIPRKGSSDRIAREYCRNSYNKGGNALTYMDIQSKWIGCYSG